jgi:hypothetical protein
MHGNIPPGCILLTDWHPLDHTPAPEYIPPNWDGPHVGKRLIEALHTLHKLPSSPGPQQYGSTWPNFARDWADRVQYEDDPTWKAEQSAERNRIKPRPTSIEIMRMEQVIGWPGRYLFHFSQLLRVVQAAAVARARHRDLSFVERRLRLPGRVVRRWNREGLDLIAAGLRRERVGVF